MRALGAADSPMVYAIGLFGDGRWQVRARKAIDTLVQPTGGLALYPANLSEIDRALQEVARDIRNQYVLTYTPATAASADFRRVKVVVRAPGHNDTLVRTRAGYYGTAQK